MLTHGSTFAYLCCKNITTNDPAKGLAKVPMGVTTNGDNKEMARMQLQLAISYLYSTMS